MFPRLLSLLGAALAALGGTLLVGVVRYVSLPDRIPLHFGLSGGTDRWVQRTPITAGMPVLLQAAVVCTTGVLLWVIMRQPEYAHRPWLPAIGRSAAWVNLLLLVVGLRQWGLMPVANTVWLLIVILIGAIGAVDLIRSAGQGRRADSDQPEERTPEIDRTEARHWKFGVLYCNAADPAMLVPKRFGVGVTLNFAHRGSWMLLGTLFLPAVVILLAVARVQR